MSKKIITVSFIILVLTATSLTIVYAEPKQAMMVPKGDIIYVGGSGPGNYSTITDALANATANDTIYVYAGMYTEGTIIINIPVTIIGESNTTTILNQTQLYMNTSNITLISCRFQNSSGITIYSINNVSFGYTIVRDSIFDRNAYGIMIFNSSHNTITNNQFTHCGIALWPNLDYFYMLPEKVEFTNTITNNIVNNKPLVYLEEVADQTIGDAGEIILLRCQNITISYLTMNTGLSLIECIDTTGSKLMNSDLRSTIVVYFNARDNTMMHNRFLTAVDETQNGGVLFIQNCTNNTVEHNMFSANFIFGLERSSNNTFMHNDFHRISIYFNVVWGINCDNTWWHNYWYRPRILPKLILGYTYTENYTEMEFSWDIDWRPALKPNNPIPNWIHTTQPYTFSNHHLWMFNNLGQKEKQLLFPSFP